MDDLRNNLLALQKFKAHLSTCFHMKDLAPLKYVLGIEVAQIKQGIYLYQCKYALDILSDASFLGAKPLAFPMEQNHQLGKVLYCLILSLIDVLWVVSFILLLLNRTWLTLCKF